MEIDREVLQHLAEQPIGAPHLQAEADSGRIQKGQAKPSGELKETIKRTAKLWLPHGRKPTKRGACNEPTAQQTDIEDAVEQRGGERGRRG
jgi:hypothetical protein